MHIVVLAIVLSGCDLVFVAGGTPSDGMPDPSGDDALIGNEGTLPNDCPTSGPPTFSSLPGQIEMCSDYSVSPARSLAVGRCTHEGASKLVEGPIESRGLSPITVIDTFLTISDPRLWPDGENLFLTASTGSQTEVRRYRKELDLAWHVQANATNGLPSVATTDGINISPPTAVLPRLVVVETIVNDVSTFTEFVEDTPGNWTAVADHVYTEETFDLIDIGQPSLSNDGKRLVFTTKIGVRRTVMYAAREDVSQPFTTASEITTGLNAVAHPHLTEQCDKLYLISILDAVVFER